MRHGFLFAPTLYAKAQGALATAKLSKVSNAFRLNPIQRHRNREGFLHQMMSLLVMLFTA
jgi:hypothetical protein